MRDKHPAVTSPRERQPYVITSALRTLEVMLMFAESPHQFGLADLMGRFGLERNQAYRSLKTLEAAGLLRQKPDGRYHLTRLVHTLSASVIGTAQASLVTLAAPYLDHLSAVTGESVHLGALVGNHVVMLDRRESHHHVRLSSAELGQSIPLHAGAIPKAVLAAAGPALLEKVLAEVPNLPRFGPRTPASAEALRSDILATRTLGYSVSDGDFDGAARGVGAAIADASGAVIGGISAGGPRFRVSDADLTHFGALVVEAAREISRQLGGVAPFRGTTSDPPLESTLHEPVSTS